MTLFQSLHGFRTKADQAFGGLIVRFNSEHLVLIVISQRFLFLTNTKKNPFTFIFLIKKKLCFLVIFWLIFCHIFEFDSIFAEWCAKTYEQMTHFIISYTYYEKSIAT